LDELLPGVAEGDDRRRRIRAFKRQVDGQMKIPF
jgi:hypothetical protein